MSQEPDGYHFFLCPNCHRISTRWFVRGTGEIYIVWKVDRFGEIHYEEINAHPKLHFICKMTICPKCGKDFIKYGNSFLIKIYRKDLYIEPVGTYWTHFLLKNPQEFQRILNKVKSQFVNLLERGELK